MITIYAGISFWLISRSWYQADDFIYLWKTDQPGKLFETMFTPYVGHLLPGDFLLTWLTQRPARMNWEINAAVTATALVIAAVLVWRVLRSLLGVRVLSVTLMIAYLTSGSIIVTSFWWAAALQYVALMIGVPLMILLLQRSLTTPTWTNAFLPVLALIATLFFAEKALVYVPFLIALVAITPLVPQAAPTAAGRLKQAARPLGGLLAVALIYGLIYLSVSSGEERRPQLTADLFGYFTVSPAVSTLFPNLVGFDDPGILLRFNAAQLLGGIVVLTLLLRTILQRRSGLRHWALLAGLIVVTATLLATATRRFPGADRYWSDLVFPMLLLIGLSQVGSRFEHDKDPDQASDGNERRPGLRLVSWPVAGMVAFASIATFNLVDHPPPLAASISESYVSNALLSAERIGGPVDLFDQIVPGRVMSGPLLRPFNTTRTVLEPSNGDFSFVESTTDLSMVLDSGEVVPARVKVIREASGVDPDCASTEPGPTQRIIDLGTKPVSPDSRIGQLDYRSDQPSQLVISWGSRSVDIPIEPGSGTVTFSIAGGDWRRMTISQSKGSTCLTALRVGSLEPR
jgi:hypothetical protein